MSLPAKNSRRSAERVVHNFWSATPITATDDTQIEEAMYLAKEYETCATQETKGYTFKRERLTKLMTFSSHKRPVLSRDREVEIEKE